MKQIHRNLLIGSILIGSALTAGSVTIPNSFTANTTAKASEVNANFSAVKSAVDGNANDIATNASGIATNRSNITTNANDIATKQQRVSANCAAGSSIRKINSDGTVVCEADTDTTYTAGTGITLSGTQLSVNTNTIQKRISSSCLSGYFIRSVGANGIVSCAPDADSGGDITSVVAGPGLEGGDDSGEVTIKQMGGYVSIGSSGIYPRLFDDRCRLMRGVNYAYWLPSSTNDTCSAVTNINLPDHATVGSITCRLYSNDTDTNDFYPAVRLKRFNLYNGEGAGTLAWLEVEHSDIDAIQTLSTLSIDNAVVDNGTYSYSIEFFAKHTATVGMKNRFYSCTIGYTFE